MARRAVISFEKKRVFASLPLVWTLDPGFCSLYDVSEHVHSSSRVSIRDSSLILPNSTCWRRIRTWNIWNIQLMRILIVSTRSFDSLNNIVLSMPYNFRSSLGKRTFSVIGPRLWNSLPPDTWYPKLVFSTNIPFLQAQNILFQNCVSSALSHLPWLDI